MRGPVLGPDGSYESAVAMRSRVPRPDRARGAKRSRSKPNRTRFRLAVYSAGRVLRTSGVKNFRLPCGLVR